MATEGSPQRPPTREKHHNEVIARRYVHDIVRDRNLAVTEELFAHPAEWKSVSLVGGETVETYDELQQYYRQALPSFREVTVENVVADRSTAMVRWTATGAVTEAFPSIPVTGTAFETTAITEFGFADGRIVALHVHVNEMDLLPDVSWPAVRSLVEEIRDGVIVLDDEDRIVHVNPAALELFDRERQALLGEPVVALFRDEPCQATAKARRTAAEEPDSNAGEQCPVATTDAGRHVSVGTSPLTDEDGEQLGRMVLVRDVTERRRRTQGLEVLNRVLRHNLRNALQVVRGRLEMAQDRADEPVVSALRPAQEQVDHLLGTAETARHVQTALDEQETARQNLGQIVSSLVDRARERYPQATIEASITDRPIVEAPTIIEDALWELVENACEHAGDRPHVEVNVGIREGAVELTVADDGSGLPDQERRVLGTARETDLEHGSGLGLWLAKWVVDSVNGSLGFTVEHGTTVQVTLPLATSR
ncbi:MAG: ATP-binding protein [Halobacteriales archaeon]